MAGELEAPLTVTITGKQRGIEVVQLYAADTATGVTLPAQQLVGFTRVDLEPGASKTVTFKLPMSLLAYTGLCGEAIIEPGPVELSARASSSDIRSTATFTITGKMRVVKGEDHHAASRPRAGPSCAHVSLTARYRFLWDRSAKGSFLLRLTNLNACPNDLVPNQAFRNYRLR